jgi:hypothetical protein
MATGGTPLQLGTVKPEHRPMSYSGSGVEDRSSGGQHAHLASEVLQGAANKLDVFGGFDTAMQKSG